MFDAIIIGAGPAGLSAASILGRCCRQVLVLNTAVYRNSAAQALHGYLTRDGVGPLEFLQIARDQLARHDTVNVRQAEVVDVRSIGEGFEVILRDGIVLSCRRLLIATGVVDALPPLVGIDALYGRSVFHCPYCDAWEYRGQALAIYGQGKHGKRLAFELTAWSNDLVLCTDGPAGLDEHDLARLAKHSVPVREDRIERLDGENGRLQRIMFAGDSSIVRSALFFSTSERQAASLAVKLGCTVDDKGEVETGKYESTNISGLYVAGDASRAVQLVIVAAAEGAEAAFSINTALLKEDLARAEAV